jgi:hypothetical protein
MRESLMRFYERYHPWPMVVTFIACICLLGTCATRCGGQ